MSTSDIAPGLLHCSFSEFKAISEAGITDRIPLCFKHVFTNIDEDVRKTCGADVASKFHGIFEVMTRLTSSPENFEIFLGLVRELFALLPPYAAPAPAAAGASSSAAASASTRTKARPHHPCVDVDYCVDALRGMWPASWNPCLSVCAQPVASVAVFGCVLLILRHEVGSGATKEMAHGTAHVHAL